MIKNIKNNKGFTVVELIVTIGVIAVLAGYLIVYNKNSQAQIILSLEQAKLVDALNTAKSLTLSTYIENFSSCGYGIYINYSNNSYEIFRYGQPPNCEAIASSSLGSILSNSSYTKIKTINLPKEVVFNTSGSNKLDAMFFIPPDPKILIWRDGSPNPITENAQNYETYIYLKTKDNSMSKTIKINVAGQISFN
jgi:prepilin-type N-terminal cleavage/methylation domain-containing protein